MNAFDAVDARAGARGGLYSALFRWLSARRADRVIVALGFLLLLPSLDTGLAADDYLHAIMLDRPSPIAGFARAPLDIFRFCDPRQFGPLLAEGIFSWWDDPNTRLAFMRPLSALTHVVDHALFRNHGAWLHLHSALWSLLLFAGVRALYSGVIRDRLVANLALALYVLDDARGWLVSWVAARNAAIATGLSVWCLVAHHAARSGRMPKWSPIGPLLFACALLSNEGAIATLGYLFAYELFLAEGARRDRLIALAPYAGLFVVWRVVYRALGFGAYGSSLYLDPLAEPRAFLGYLLHNGPLLLASQFGGIWSDASNILFVLPRVHALVFGATLCFVGYVLWLMRKQLATSELSRFALLGTLCALFPATTAAPVLDRMLSWVGIGASILLAQLIAPALRKPEGSIQPSSRAHRISIAVLVAVHLAGVAFLPSRARGNLVMRDMFGRAEAAIPRDPSVSDKTLIYVNPPHLPYAAYMPLERAALGIPRPRSLHILGSSTTELELTRTDERTLRIHARDGFLLDPVSRLLWSDHRPFHVGERIVQADMAVTVLSVTSDHRPLAIEARFDRPLEDAGYLWVDWRGTRSAAFVPPRVGEVARLPAADYFQSVLGVQLPIEARY